MHLASTIIYAIGNEVVDLVGFVLAMPFNALISKLERFGLCPAFAQR